MRPSVEASPLSGRFPLRHISFQQRKASRQRKLLSFSTHGRREASQSSTLSGWSENTAPALQQLTAETKGAPKTKAGQETARGAGVVPGQRDLCCCSSGANPRNMGRPAGQGRAPAPTGGRPGWELEPSRRVGVRLTTWKFSWSYRELLRGLTRDAAKRPHWAEPSCKEEATWVATAAGLVCPSREPEPPTQAGRSPPHCLASEPLMPQGHGTFRPAWDPLDGG